MACGVEGGDGGTTFGSGRRRKEVVEKTNFQPRNAFTLDTTLRGVIIECQDGDDRRPNQEPLLFSPAALIKEHHTKSGQVREVQFFASTILPQHQQKSLGRSQ